MKKTIIVLAVVMTALLCVILAGCGSSGGGDLSDSKYVGTWKAVSMSLGDEEEPYDGECILTLNGDGTGVLEDGSGEEEATQFNWELTDEGFKTTGDMKMKFVDNGDTISGKILGANLNFEKQ